tara:strand:- start:1661 stop:2245 length:585 start_codon:yes stop_codon:yes gene_type:complete
MSIETVDGDLLDKNNACDIIIQQLNCTCVKGHGLSDAISQKYPYAEIYSHRKQFGKKNVCLEKDRGIPGKITVSFPIDDGIGIDGVGPIVIGFYGQYDFGKAYFRAYRPRLPAKYAGLYGPSESKGHRENWFRKCLDNFIKWIIANRLNHPEVVIGIPFGIGCGLAGGIWRNYLTMLEKFNENVKCKVKIIKLA